MNSLLVLLVADNENFVQNLLLIVQSTLLISCSQNVRVSAVGLSPATEFCFMFLCLASVVFDLSETHRSKTN